MLNQTIGNVRKLSFDNYTDFMELTTDVNKHAVLSYGNAQALQSHNFGFHHTHDYAEALKLAREGWPDGRTQTAKIVDTLNITSHVYRPENYFDVSGDYGFDMGRVMTGEPENVIAERLTDVESPNGPIIRITVNIAASAGISTQVMINRGAAILALIDALESAGKRVELDAIVYLQKSRMDRYGSTKEQGYIEVPLKRPEYATQTDQIAFALAHPSFFRRFCFVAMNDIGFDASACIPADLPETPEGIYLRSMHFDDKTWASIPNMREWIIAELTNLGIALENE